NTPVVVNAASYGDLAIVVLGLLRAEAAGKRFLYRTAASFVRLRGAVTPQPLLTTDQIMRGTPITQAGGLVVVGSYVPGSSVQLENLLVQDGVVGIELPVERILQADADVDAIYRDLSQQLDKAISAGHTGILYTSRKLITGASDDESLAIGKKVSAALIAIVHGITERPRFIIAKGGITSHIIAQHGFGATSARVLGQILPGVSVWTLESGTRFQGIPYVVFPGNVGNAESLGQAVQTLHA
ncbi:MAG TPA: nucleotide-binding domain containing protein, partial [Ktedonobacteraceae bacterium]